MADSLRPLLGGRAGEQLGEVVGGETVRDLLHHFPRRYYRRGELTDLGTLAPDEEATILARIVSVRGFDYRDRSSGRTARRVEVVVTDGRHQVLLTFFRLRWLERARLTGRVGLFSGKVGTWRGRTQLVHPQFQLLGGHSDDLDAVASWTADVIPIYPASSSVTSTMIAKAVETVLPQVDFTDPVPEQVRTALGLVDLRTAMTGMHRPAQPADADDARARFVYEEAFLLQTVLALRRQHSDSLAATARPGRPDGLLADFDATSGLSPTPGQRQVGDEIARDLSRTRPMHRLLQGDVGTGKTLVALRAMLQVADSGGQSVLMAPTEVLAQQHHAGIVALLGERAQAGMLGGAEQATRVTLLTGSTPAAARRAALAEIADGTAGIIVGTHALIQQGVEYHDLGLIVVDEQHRFGVQQRSALLERVPGQRPHLLVMTATPIPRTVAMTVFGDLDVSTLTGRPLGDPRIVTHVVSEHDRPSHLGRAWDRVREEVAAGRAVFVVCPRIDETDVADLPLDSDGDALELLFTAKQPHSVVALADELSRGPLADCRVAVLHGRLRAAEKDDVLRRFALGPGHRDGVDVLVCTTVIEVGVDIRGATMMVIMDAERFGVSQLHQLRGRVGRAGQEAVCLLVTQAPEQDPAYERLGRIAATDDGFELARLDLEQRREGDVLGELQSGRRSSLKLLSVLRDEAVIARARHDAVAVLAADPTLQAHPALAAEAARLAADDHTDYLEKA